MDTGRRSFLTGASGAVLAIAALDWRQLAQAAAHAQEAAASPDAVLSVLTEAQAATIDAIASRIVPTDELPGAHEAGVVYFIDQALGSFFAPAREDFLLGLAGFESHASAVHAGSEFTAIASQAQDVFLRSVETTPFFGQLRTWTIYGLLASPGYGGNRGLAGWKLAGFEEAHQYMPPFGYYDRGYPGFEPYPPDDKS